MKKVMTIIIGGLLAVGGFTAGYIYTHNSEDVLVKDEDGTVDLGNGNYVNENGDVRINNRQTNLNDEEKEKKHREDIENTNKLQAAAIEYNKLINDKEEEITKSKGVDINSISEEQKKEIRDEATKEIENSIGSIDDYLEQKGLSK